LNCALHITAIAQIRDDTEGRVYYRRKHPRGESRKEALRCLKRRLADVVYRAMTRDQDTSLAPAA
jgi:hypothetical protein